MPYLPEPLPVGTRVYHANQHWASTLPGGTAKIIEVRPWTGGHAYQVLTARDFSRRPGPDNPLTRNTWWYSSEIHSAVES